MGDDSDSADHHLLARLNALKKSSVSLQGSPSVRDSQALDLGERFRKLNNGRSPPPMRSDPLSIEPTAKEAEPRSPSPTLEELLEELSVEEGQQRLRCDELSEAAELLAEAKRALPSDQHRQACGSRDKPQIKQSNDRNDHWNASEDCEENGAEVDKEAEAATALQQILDEMGAEEDSSEIINNNLSPAANVEKVIDGNGKRADMPNHNALMLPKSPTSVPQPQSPHDQIFPSAPTNTPAAPTSKTLSRFPDSEIEHWCIICLADATVRCLGCAGDVYCITCWKEGHSGPDAGYEEKRHKALAIRRNTLHSI